MVRNKKTKFNSLHQQAYKRIIVMQAFGEKKREAEAMGIARKKIFSFNTYKTYWKHVKYFLKWIQKNHPECTTLNSAEKYVKEWLEERTEAGLSAWTIHTEAKALGKLYGITPDSPNYFVPPKRRRADIKRSRYASASDRNFSEKKNAQLVNFCKATGLRRSELGALRGSDLFTKEQIMVETNDLLKKCTLTAKEEKRLAALKDAWRFEYEYFMHVRSGKGGRERFSPVIGKDVSEIVDRMRSMDPDEKVWKRVHSCADVHSYRAVYATNLYKEHARAIEDIPYDKIHSGLGYRYQGDVYCCRKDMAGKKLDKKAMLLCSKALGHNRLNVVANNYIREL